MPVSNPNHDKLVDIIATLLEVEAEAITHATSPETVAHWDSLNHMSICMAVCDEFDVSMTTAEMASFRNVGDLVAHLNSKGAPCE